MTDQPSHLPTPAPGNLPAVIKPKVMDEVQQSKLAREVVMDIRNISEVLKEYGLTAKQYKDLATQPYYKKALEIALQEWNSALTTVQRIKVKAAALLEQNLLNLGVRMGQETENLPAVVETGKLLTKLAGIGEQGQQQNSGEKFSITISMGGDATLKFEKDVTPTQDLPAIDVIEGTKK